MNPSSGIAKTSLGALGVGTDGTADARSRRPVRQPARQPRQPAARGTPRPTATSDLRAALASLDFPGSSFGGVAFPSPAPRPGAGLASRSTSSPGHRDQRTPHPPNDRKQSIHTSDGVRANRDLLPVRAVADSQARHRTSPASAQMNDAPREPRRRHTSRHSGGNVRESRILNLLAAPNLLKAARNLFTHN